MTYSIYDASIVPVKHSLESLKAILKKAEASEKASEFPETRLHPDMLPLAFQIHMITNVRPSSSKLPKSTTMLTT
jgi:hypothetical protein